jgi:hypothetical protein
LYTFNKFGPRAMNFDPLHSRPLRPGTIVADFKTIGYSHKLAPPSWSIRHLDGTTDVRPFAVIFGGIDLYWDATVTSREANLDPALETVALETYQTVQPCVFKSHLTVIYVKDRRTQFRNMPGRTVNHSQRVCAALTPRTICTSHVTNTATCITRLNGRVIAAGRPLTACEKPHRAKMVVPANE